MLTTLKKPQFSLLPLSCAMMAVGTAGLFTISSTLAATASQEHGRPPIGQVQAQASVPLESIAMFRSSRDKAFATDRVIVKFKALSTNPITTATAGVKGSPAQQGATIERALTQSARQAVAAVKGKIMKGSTRTGLVVVKTSLKVGDAIEQLYRSGTVEFAQPDYKYHLSRKPTDPLFAEQWGLNNTGQSFYSDYYQGVADADIDGVEAWNTKTAADDVIIGIVDTGIAYDHKDLAKNMWTNPGEIPGNQIDDDGNGFVDDVYGINAYTNEYSSEYTSIDPYDDNGHGTHVSGIASARGNNGIGITGVAWKSKLMALKFLDSWGSGYSSDAITLIDYALDMKQRYGYQHLVLNASWGSSEFDQALYDALDAARNAGVLFFAAAGNSTADVDHGKFYPAGYDLPNIITVGATDASDKMAYFSNYGCGSVDLFAPGDYILSTVPYDYYKGKYDFYSGTSMATPMVTGAAALLWSQYPAANWQKIKSALLNGVDQLPSLSRRAISGGRLNLDGAFSAFSPSAPAVWSVAPASAAPGDTVTITGDGFGNSAGSVMLGSQMLTVSSWSDSRIGVTLPPGTAFGVGQVSVIKADQRSTVAGGCMRVGYYETLVGNTLLPHTRHASVQDGSTVWLFGGVGSGYSQSGLVEKYDLKTAKSTVSSQWSMPVATTNISAALVGKKAYIAGGYNAGSYQAINTLQIFDLSTKTWSIGPSLPAPRWGSAMAASGGLVYVFGGADGSSDTASPVTYIYNPTSNSWKQGAEMPEALVFPAARVLANGKVRLYGGFSSLYYGSETAKVMEYSPATDTWKTLPDMPTARGGATVINSGSTVGVLHGAGMGATTDDFLNLVTGKWLVDPVEGAPLFLSTGAVLNKQGYVFNGEDYDIYQSIYRLPMVSP